MIYYHYCRLESFVSIVRHKTLRLGNIFYMNDSKEVSWFFGIARGIIEEHLESWSGGVGSSSSGSGSTGASSVGSGNETAVWKLSQMLEREPFDHIYAACFSQKKDDLSQWRGYADDGRGVELGIDLDVLCKQARCPLLKKLIVKYDEAEQRREAKRILTPLFEPDSSDSSGSSYSGSSSFSGGLAKRTFRQVAQVAPCYKNPAFAAEEEVRLVVRTRVPADTELDRATFDAQWFRGFPAEVSFDQNRVGLVPYTTVPLPQSAIRSVGFGPKFGGYANKAAVKLFCGKRLPRAKIEFYDSQASYR